MVAQLVKNLRAVQETEVQFLGREDPLKGQATTPVFLGLPGGCVVENPPASVGDMGSVPGRGRSSGEGNGNPLQYSCLRNPMNRAASWATVHASQESDMTLQLNNSNN